VLEQGTVETRERDARSRPRSRRSCLSSTGLAHLSAQQRAAVTPALADAFATTFWVAVALITLAPVPAVVLPHLRRRKQARGAAYTTGAAAH